MKWIDKLEKRFGRYGIRDLTAYMIICYIAGYAIYRLNKDLIGMLNLDVEKILHGQIWRLFTWVIYPPSKDNPLLFAVSIFLFYLPIGRNLERTWGTFRYNLYIFSGLLFTVLSAFILYAITGGTFSANGILYYYGGNLFSTYYISLSLFLAYALSYPDAQILFWFIIPIRMKWMAIVYLLLIGYDMLSYIRMGYWVMAVPIAASLLNFVIFYLSTRNLSRYNPKQVKRRREFTKAVNAGRVSPGHNGTTRHKCCICGRTEVTNPELDFRFCSRCNGSYEYCNDHLFTHPHKQ